MFKTKRNLAITALLSLGLVALGTAGFVLLRTPLPTGKTIEAIDNAAAVGSFPVNMALSPDGRFVAVSDAGFRQHLSIIDAGSGRVVGDLDFNETEDGRKKQLYFGLAFGPDSKLYVSRGGEDKISIVDISPAGLPTLEPNSISIPSGVKDEPNFIAGIAVSYDGKLLAAACNETYFHKQGDQLSGGHGHIAFVDLQSGNVLSQTETGGFPFDVAMIDQAGKPRVFTSSERDGVVEAFDASPGVPPAKAASIPVGSNPSMMALDHARKTLYVSNANSDTVSVIDAASGNVKGTILIRPVEARGLPGCTPLGLALTPDDRTLFVAMADLNAVAVIDAASAKLRGWLPAGWYPTSVVVSRDGRSLFVADGKGTVARTPNAKNVAKHGTYIENLLEGVVQKIDLGTALPQLKELSRKVLADNRFTEQPRMPFANPHPKHVVYIIKENRTYDNVFGDIKEGNGDAGVCLFPQDVTPNQHALARRFGLMDNFYVCSEVSADGWNWSTAGMANEYTQRNTLVNYGGRGRAYDFDGMTNDVYDDDEGVRDVAEPPGGYLWDAAIKAGVEFRNYGCFVEWANPTPNSQHFSKATKKVLDAKTDRSFREFDMAYPDSDAWIKLNHHFPKQMLKFGPSEAPSRYTEWKREFDQFVANGNLPTLTMMTLPHNHTQGTAPGYATPQAMVADNDYAVGEVVDAISHSPYWKDTVICILEDDAQNGKDHVDCHRSPALIISAFNRGGVDHRFWNTDSMLRTIEVMLNIPPMCQYDGFASPIDAFAGSPANSQPYQAIMPNAEILNAANSQTAYRAKDSVRLLDRMRPDVAPDAELNDILWHAVKG